MLKRFCRRFYCYNVNMDIPIDWNEIDSNVKEFSYVKSPNQQVLSFSPRSDETIHHH